MGDSEFYQITSSGRKTVSEDEFWEQRDTIAVIDADKLKNSQTFGQFCSSCTERGDFRRCHRLHLEHCRLYGAALLLTVQNQLGCKNFAGCPLIRR